MKFSGKTPLLILMFFVIACNNKKDSNLNEINRNENISTHSFYNKEYQDSDRIEDLKKSIQIKGDTIAFLKLKEIYFTVIEMNSFTQQFLCRMHINIAKHILQFIVFSKQIMVKKNTR